MSKPKKEDTFYRELPKYPKKSKGKCPVPNCPENDIDNEPLEPDPNCKCNEPIWISLRPGQHIHPCPVHPERIIRGSSGGTL